MGAAPYDPAHHSRGIHTPPARVVAFPLLLREYRDRSRLSQARLAEAAGFDHSYVSRLESGVRAPSQATVLKLVDALRLDAADRDALLAAAGFAADNTDTLVSGEPVLMEALRVLRDEGIPAEIRDDVRNMIGLLVRQAQRAAADHARSNGTVVVACG